MRGNSAAPHSFGFGELWICAVGERPWRWFCALWFALFLASLLYPALLYERMDFIGKPPLAAAVPYHDYLPGGSRESEIGELQIDPATLPTYDASVADPSIQYHLRPLPPKGGPVRLHAVTPRYRTTMGSVMVGASRAWDVTDPASTDQPGTDTWQRGPYTFWHAGQVAISWGYAEGAGDFGMVCVLPGSLIHLALPQFAAALIVIPLAIGFRTRRRRRLRRGQCIECGHTCDAQRRPGLCPECGCPPLSAPSLTGNGVRRLVASPGRVATLLFAIAVSGWIVVQVSLHHTDHWNSDEKKELVAGFADDTGRILTRHISTEGSRWGWPADLLWVQHAEWFTFAPNTEPQPASHGMPPYAWNGNSFSWVIEQGTPSVTRSYEFNWAIAVLQLAVLHTIAAVLAAALWAGLRSRRFPRSPPGGNGNN